MVALGCRCDYWDFQKYREVGEGSLSQRWESLEISVAKSQHTWILSRIISQCGCPKTMESGQRHGDDFGVWEQAAVGALFGWALAWPAPLHGALNVSNMHSCTKKISEVCFSVLELICESFEQGQWMSLNGSARGGLWVSQSSFNGYCDAPFFFLSM